MGYTNYWKTKKLDTIPEKFWKDAEMVFDEIFGKGIILGDAFGEDIVVKTTEIIDKENNRIVFNGYSDEAYETFNLVFDGDFNLCKTARKPYDIVVKVILMLADFYGLLADNWSFDGIKDDKEYINAKELFDYIVENNK